MKNDFILPGVFPFDRDLKDDAGVPKPEYNPGSNNWQPKWYNRLPLIIKNSRRTIPIYYKISPRDMFTMESTSSVATATNPHAIKMNKMVDRMRKYGALEGYRVVGINHNMELGAFASEVTVMINP